MLLSGKQSRRSISNVASQLCSYNSGISPTIIPAHNDAFRIEFSKFPTDANASPFLCGQEDEESTEIRYPIHRRRIFYPTASFDASKEETKEEQEQEKAESDKVLLENKEQIDASLHCQDELAAMVISGCQSLLGITLENLKESLAAAYGAGCSSAVIVDVGAEETSVAIVEDGILDVDSRQSLGFGSDDILILFMELLKGIDFPYTALSLSCSPDVNLLTELKERCWTLEDATELSTQVVDFLVRIPGRSTASYHFKAHEERIMSPLTYFNPSFIDVPSRAAASLKASQYFLSDQDSEVLMVEKTKKKILAEQIADEQDENSFIEDSINLGSSLSVSLAPCANEQLSASSTITSDTCPCCRACLMKEPSISCCCFQGETPEIKALFNHIASAHMNATDVTCQWIDRNSHATCGHFFSSIDNLEIHIMRHITEELFPSPSQAPMAASKSEKKPCNIKNELSSLHELIFSAILKHENADRIDKIRKWLGMILLVGSGHQIAGFQQMLRKKLSELALSSKSPLASVSMPPSIESESLISYISLPKDIDIGSLAWKGAGVIARVDASRESWISAKEWDVLQMRAVVDRFQHIK
ncbi:hypothetical protein DI09_131p20 [Mitosporidium daphniae]|uniref:Uncharacterized protein n=1 Tax=Mitosporidium daphniae TaxID=1485682 RepID=A0A098VUN3_9MICR|nr:uncharacterized protein DI09_131p20 [Mitosporidium daphniae]KGG52818.1 hypothetical protein DI09_131p20 [Mitosporidium daphniae]|eukprot:XP_013239254.1 uncharacterized protein DI09_131p20 [Mitosporidium daphniae]